MRYTPRLPSYPPLQYEGNGKRKEYYHFGTFVDFSQLFSYSLLEPPIKIRNKPRPGNEWWNTNILDDLKGVHCLVTNMSLAAVDAIINGVPCITDKKNVANFVSSQDISKINLPFKPNNNEINKWMRMLSHNQFTIREIEDGIAFKVLQEQI